MLKSLAQLLVALIPTTEPAPSDGRFDIAALTCHQFTSAADATRLAAIDQINDRLAQIPGNKPVRQRIEDLLFRIDLACLDTPQALVLQIVSQWQRPLGNAAEG